MAASKIIFERGTVLETLNASIASADWLTPADGAAIELARRLAERVDADGFPMVDGRFDNVSESQLVKLLGQLGLLPNVRAEWKQEEGPSGSSKLARLQKEAAKVRGPARTG